MDPYYATKRYPFMSCIIRVGTRSNWQRTVRRVLDNCNGVSNFRMDDNGVVEISGTVDPSLLLKMLEKAGRSAELCWFQFGECSSNLFMPVSVTGGSYYAGDGRHLHVGNTPRPKLPHSQQPQNYGGYYEYDQHHYYQDQGYPQLGYHHNQGSGLGLGHDQYDDYQSGYSHATGNQIQNPPALPYHYRRADADADQDIACCTVM